MNADVSENLFKKYLEEHNFKYTRDYYVNSHNVDFRILTKKVEVLADVKSGNPELMVSVMHIVILE